MRRVSVAAAAVLAGVASVAAIAGCGGGEESRPLVGFSNNAVYDGAATPEQAARMISATGATVDRVQVNWAQLEPRPGEYHFELYDTIYRADLAHGVWPLFNLAFAPAWASDVPCAPACHAPPSRQNFGAAAAAAAALAQRYPNSVGIEIWNEPNGAYWWAPRPDPTAYAELLKASSAAIDAVDPSMPVVGGSTSSSPARTDSGTIPPVDFLRSIYDRGAGEAMDVLSLHVYVGSSPQAGAYAAERVEVTMEALDGAGPAHPVWVTETGTTTTGRDAATEGDQALAVVRVFEALRSVEQVEMVLVHTLVEPPRPNPADRHVGYGVVDSALSPKPAYCSLARAWSGSDAC